MSANARMFLFCVLFFVLLLVFASFLQPKHVLCECERKKRSWKVKFTYTTHQPIQSDLLHSGVATSYIISLSNQQRMEGKKERKRKHCVYRYHTRCALNSQQKRIKLANKKQKKRNYYILSRHLSGEKIETSSYLFISSCALRCKRQRREKMRSK